MDATTMLIITGVLTVVFTILAVLNGEYDE